MREGGWSRRVWRRLRRVRTTHAEVVDLPPESSGASPCAPVGRVAVERSDACDLLHHRLLSICVSTLRSARPASSVRALRHRFLLGVPVMASSSASSRQDRHLDLSTDICSWPKPLRTAAAASRHCTYSFGSWREDRSSSRGFPQHKRTKIVDYRLDCSVVVYDFQEGAMAKKWRDDVARPVKRELLHQSREAGLNAVQTFNNPLTTFKTRDVHCPHVDRVDLLAPRLLPQRTRRVQILLAGSQKTEVRQNGIRGLRVLGPCRLPQGVFVPTR